MAAGKWQHSYLTLFVPTALTYVVQGTGKAANPCNVQLDMITICQNQSGLYELSWIMLSKLHNYSVTMPYLILFKWQTYLIQLKKCSGFIYVLL